MNPKVDISIWPIRSSRNAERVATAINRQLVHVLDYPEDAFFYKIIQTGQGVFKVVVVISYAYRMELIGAFVDQIEKVISPYQKGYTVTVTRKFRKIG